MTDPAPTPKTGSEGDDTTTTSTSTSTSTSGYVLRSQWSPHIGQRAIMAHDARFRIVACGRRWGKSEMCAHLAVERALEDSATTVWWVAPSYEQANSYGFKKIDPLLSADILSEEPTLTKPREISLVNGSTLSFRSAEREDSLRGGGVNFLIIDEAGSVPDRAWTNELRPTLSDTVGEMIAIGTPKGRNWFSQWFQRGQSSDHPDVASWQAPTKQNPHVPDSEIDSARQDMPDRVFEQEYQAEFVEAGGSVFTDVRERTGEDYLLPVGASESRSPYRIGVDLARADDWTVVIVIDEDDRVVAFERVQETTWSRIQEIIERVADRYEPSNIAVDRTRDNKIVEDIEMSGYQVEPIQFSSRKKQTLIENLVTMIETDRLTIPASAETLLSELERYTVERTDTGRASYSAPHGCHDDCVDALALAVSATSPAQTTVPGSFF